MAYCLSDRHSKWDTVSVTMVHTLQYQTDLSQISKRYVSTYSQSTRPASRRPVKRVKTTQTRLTPRLTVPRVNPRVELKTVYEGIGAFNPTSNPAALRMESSTPVTRLINEMESLFGTSINRGLGDSIWGLRMTLLRSELFTVCGTTPTTSSPRRTSSH